MLLNPSTLSLIKIHRPSWVLRYGLTIVVCIANIYLKQLLRLDVGTPYLTALFSVFISSYYGGIVPGILATLLTAFLVNYFFIPPVGAIVLNTSSSVHLIAYLTEGLVVSFVMELLSRNQEALYRKGEWFATTLGSIGDGVITTDAAGRVTFMNQVAEKLTGWSLATAAGYPIQKIFPLLHDKTQKKVINPILRVLKKSRVETLTNHTLLVTKTGEKLAIDDSAAPIQGSTGKLIGAVLVFRDIAWQRSLEQQKDDFIAITSHELRTPLTSIKAFSQVLEKRLRQKGDQDASVLLSRINDQTLKMTEMVNTFLDVSRIETGNLKLQPSRFNLKPLITRQINDLTKTDPLHHEIKLDYQLSGLVTADKNRLEQVITNLLVNAIKYSPKVTPITVTVTSNKHQLILSVKDHGIGIPKGQQALVFDRFYRVNSSANHTPVTGGYGIGLYIVKKIIQAHHGKIWVESVQGTGSTFFISLPLK